MRKLIKKTDYPDARIGDIVLINKILSDRTKVTFKAIIHGYVPQTERGTGRFIVKVLDMVEPSTVRVSSVKKV